MYLSRSFSPIANVGGSVQTPFGQSLVSRGLALISDDRAWLQGCEARRERLLGIAVAHPVVKISKREDQVRRAGWRDLKVAGAQGRFVNGAKPVFFRGDARAKTGRAGPFLAAGGRQGNRVMAAGRQVGTQYVGPITATRP